MRLRDIPQVIAQHGQAYEGASQSFFGWILAGVGTIIAALASAVAGLYRAQIKGYEDRIKSLETELGIVKEKVSKCHQEHEVTRIELGRMEERLKYLEVEEEKR